MVLVFNCNPHLELRLSYHMFCTDVNNSHETIKDLDLKQVLLYHILYTLAYYDDHLCQVT